MTVAIGALMGDHALLLSDSVAMQAETRSNMNCRKIYAIDGLAMTGAGSRALVLLAWDILTEAAEAADEGELAITEFCAALRKALDDAGAKPNEEGHWQVAMLITDGRSLQLINSMCLPEEVGPFCAIGAGRMEAYAAREAARLLGADLRRQLEICVEATAAVERDCGGAVQVVKVTPGALTLVR